MRSSNTEIHILGTLISEGTQMVDVVDVLTPDMFESMATSSVYAAMQKMFDENKGIDLVTLSERVVGDKAIEAKGVPDPYYLDKKVKLVELFSYHKLGLTNKYTHLFGDS